jgi:hypothetical protein
MSQKKLLHGHTTLHVEHITQSIKIPKLKRITYRAVNTLRLGYKNQSVNAV